MLEGSRRIYGVPSTFWKVPEGSKDYVPNITPSFSFEVSEKQRCCQSVPTQEDEDLPHDICNKLQLLFTRQVVHRPLKPTIVAHAFHF